MDPAEHGLPRHKRSAWARRLLGIAVAWVICCLGWPATYLVPNRFESSARLFVDAGALLTPRGSGTSLEILQHTLLSKGSLDRLVSATALGRSVSGPVEREQLLTRLADEIRIGQQTKDLFTISYVDKSPLLARDVVRTLVSFIAQSATASNANDSQATRRALERQVQTYEQQLRAAEKRRADFRARYKALFPGFMKPDWIGVEPQRILLHALDGELADAVVQRDAVRLEVETRFPSAGADATKPSEPNPAYEFWKLKLIQAEAQVTSLKRRRDEVKTTLESLEKISLEQPGLVTEYQNMDRDYKVLRKNYEEVLSRLQSAAILREPFYVEKTTFQIVDPPEIPRLPASPNRPMMITAVLLGALVIGLGIAVLPRRRSSPGGEVDGPAVPVLPMTVGEQTLYAAAFGVAVLGLLILYGAIMVHALRMAALI